MPQQVLGIALEDNHLTAVRLTGHSRAYDVTLALRQPLPVHDDPEEHATLQRESVRQLVEAHGLRGDTVLASLPAQRAILRNLTLPFRDLRRVRQMIAFALDEHMPFEPEDVVVDFRPLPIQQVPQQTQVLVAAMPKQEIVDDMALFRSAGLEPSALDLDVFSLASAAVLGSNGLPGRTALLYVDVERTLLILLQDDAPLFARSLARSMPDAQHLGRQLQHTVYACEHVAQVAYEPDLLLLFGADRDQLAPLAVGLGEATGLHTQVWQLEAPGYKPANGRGASSEPGPAGHAIALGAALRGLHRQAGGLNLRRGEFAPHSNLRELRGKLIALSVLAVAVGGLGLGNLYLQNRYKASHLSQLEDSIARSFSDVLPGARMVQPVAQMREKINDLDKRLQAFGGLTGGRAFRASRLARAKHPGAGIVKGRGRQSEHRRRRDRVECQHGVL